MPHNVAKGAQSLTMTLTTLDLSLFKNGRVADRQQFASQLLSGLSQHGFVKLVGHGISDSAISQSFGWVGPQLPICFNKIHERIAE